MVGELEGEQKSDESMMGLVRARKYLQRRFGTVHVSFGEPISLADSLGDRRARFASDDSPEVAAEQRVFIQMLGDRIVERINWAVIPNATAIAACAMLGYTVARILLGLSRRGSGPRLTVASVAVMSAGLWGVLTSRHVLTLYASCFVTGSALGPYWPSMASRETSNTSPTSQPMVTPTRVGTAIHQ